VDAGLYVVHPGYKHEDARVPIPLLVVEENHVTQLT
jgi:hypothetical protein